MYRNTGDIFNLCVSNLEGTVLGTLVIPFGEGSEKLAFQQLDEHGNQKDFLSPKFLSYLENVYFIKFQFLFGNLQVYHVLDSREKLPLWQIVLRPWRQYEVRRTSSEWAFLFEKFLRKLLRKTHKVIKS